MKPLADFVRIGIKLTTYARVHPNFARFAMLLLAMFSVAVNLSAQSVRWSDTFQQGAGPTFDQCKKWTTFLDQLGEKKFTSVKFYGQNDPVGKTITDAAAVSELAALLYSRTPGVVTVGSDSWVVSSCGASSCNTQSVALSFNGNKLNCECSDTYSVRPHGSAGRWGGLNTVNSCDAPDQTINLEFNSGVTISASGPTAICKGGSVVLTAKTDICVPPLTYLWSNGATTESIVVTNAGDFSVTVSGANSCSGVSETIAITLREFTISVDAGADQITCDDPVSLKATGVAGGSAVLVNKFCVLDALDPSNNAGDCTFPATLCEDGWEPSGDRIISQAVTLSNPVAIRYRLYYLPLAQTTFVLKLNGQQLGLPFIDNDISGFCERGNQYPRTFSFAQNAFINYWKPAAENILTVEIRAEDGSFSLAGLVIEVDVAATESYSWSPVIGLSDPTSQSPQATVSESRTYTVTYKDGIGCAATDDVNVIVNCNTAPVARCVEPFSMPVGADCKAVISAAQINNGSSDPLNRPLTYSISPNEPLTVGTHVITLTVVNDRQESSSCQTTVTVLNAEPVIASVTALPSPAAVNSPVKLTTVFADNNIMDATIDWGDFSEIQTVIEPQATFDVSHAYSSAGSYDIAVTLMDECGKSTYAYETIVVSNNRGVSVSGSGWFQSPPGAYFKDRRAAGKANFSFQASYTSLSEVPVGDVSFNFKDVKFKFKSTAFQWLMVDGQSASMKANGKVNNLDGYQILISVRDAITAGAELTTKIKPAKAIDMIRVKVWDPSGAVIYDTQAGEPDDATPVTPLGAGSVEISDENSGFSTMYESPVATSYGGETTSVYPNPYNDFLDVQFNSVSKENVIFQILDLAGKVIFNQIFPANEDGTYSLDIPDDKTSIPGIYLLTIKQGKRVEIVRIVRN
jgi:hypothetical protein